MYAIRFLTTHGDEFVVDDTDRDKVEGRSWQSRRKGANVYVAHCYKYKNSRRVRWIHLHQVIMGHPFVDHMDGNGLNNRRSNLRMATTAQNNRNQKLRSTNTSGFKGVVARKGGGWRAQIYLDRKQITIGQFSTPEEAARAYDQKALELHGEFAKTNSTLGLLDS